MGGIQDLSDDKLLHSHQQKTQSVLVLILHCGYVAGEQNVLETTIAKALIGVI